MRVARLPAALCACALVLGGCSLEEPVPHVTVFSGATSERVPPTCWNPEDRQAAPDDCAIDADRIGSLRVAAGDTIGISVDTELADTGWVPTIGEQRLVPDALDSSYYRFALSDADLAAGELELRIFATAAQDPALTRGLWVLALRAGLSVRFVVITATIAERDAAIAGSPPARAARLAPYASTRVAQTAAGTVVVVPAAGGVAAAATAAAVATNRLAPDAVLVVGTAAVAGGHTRIAGDAGLLHVLRRLLPSAVSGPPAGPLAEGAAVAAAVHSVPCAQLLAADLAALEAACVAAFGSPWEPLLPEPPPAVPLSLH